MAGLQQYNFFPTDLLYPRPQPQQSSTKPTVLPVQTPNAEDQQQPSRSMIKATPASASSVVLHSQKMQSIGVVDNKVSKFYADPLSWMVWEEEDEVSSDSF